MWWRFAFQKDTTCQKIFFVKKHCLPSKISMAADLSPYRLLVVAVALLVIGTTGFYSIDGMIDKDASGSRLINSFYCATITLTTYVSSYYYIILGVIFSVICAYLYVAFV